MTSQPMDIAPSGARTMLRNQENHLHPPDETASMMRMLAPLSSSPPAMAPLSSFIAPMMTTGPYCLWRAAAATAQTLHDGAANNLNPATFPTQPLVAQHDASGLVFPARVLSTVAETSDFLRRESRTIACLTHNPHPNIASVVDVVGAGVQAPMALVYQPVQGTDLHSFLKHGWTFAEDDARHIFAQICATVAHCHSINLVIGDMKLSKIVLTHTHQHQVISNGRQQRAHLGLLHTQPAQTAPATPDAISQLSDPFGGAMGFGAPRSALGHQHTRLAPHAQFAVTEPQKTTLPSCSCNQRLRNMDSSLVFSDMHGGVVSPTIVASCVQLVDLEKAILLEHEAQLVNASETSCSPAYVAPEMLERKPYRGQQADAYSLGIILYTMMRGAYPFSDTSPKALFAKILSGQAPMPSGLSAHGRDLLRRLMHRNPDERLTVAQALNHPWFTESSATNAGLQLAPQVSGVAVRSSCQRGNYSADTRSLRSARSVHAASSVQAATKMNLDDQIVPCMPSKKANPLAGSVSRPLIAAHA
ncbi:serine/threonine protein kinase [Capsaspora owczarzaki ATCC 30864]|uniref:CAMK/TRBL protein kinase n=1 Tax=Capsaspora owczarzaki (strain ATCC 30864) TaxID=595528 RepID=A0A0D2WLG2_CAPO3|nr:serine/threonine protein kinase [Capsaspora owczarzaki ATCC 30864]KJE90678.1 CAMK/TRBL protein kinase [Capsaspora owczarzaki ATCC 30864]|eukprot:XP_004364816.1 serine/threonine protein kinase [Capsaspora owczarzaki ATCC 30864]